MVKKSAQKIPRLEPWEKSEACIVKLEGNLKVMGEYSVLCLSAERGRVNSEACEEHPEQFSDILSTGEMVSVMLVCSVS